uniref:Uncharacterized protein n=1 Tax=Amphimedon queenslandica TaxID=400682 RepID=A0A1X7TWZ3_AMPQE
MAKLQQFEVEIQEKVQKEHWTQDRLSSHLKAAHPGERGLSVCSIEKFCSENDIHKTAKLSDVEVDDLVAEAIDKATLFGTLHFMYLSVSVKNEVAIVAWTIIEFYVVVPDRKSELNSPKRLRIETRKFLPPLLTSTRNRKEELYNSVVQQLSVDGLGWHEPLKITSKSNSYQLQSIYQSSTGDCSAATTMSEEEIDKLVTEALAIQDPDIIVDLRH